MISDDVFEAAAATADNRWPVLHPAALHGLAGDIVRTLEPHTEADPVGLLADFLVSFGSCVGAGPYAVADASLHPARLNVVLVGDTSRSRKGTTRSNISGLFREADLGWAEKQVMGGLSTGEGLIATVSDGTTNAKGEVEGEKKDKRLLVVEPEFARVLSVASRDGNILSAVLRDAWDSGRLRVMTRREPLVATGAHISVLGHVTIEEITRRLGEVEIANGFANRFLFVCVRRSKLLPSGGNLHPDDFARLVRLLRNSIEGARKISRVRRTESSEALWGTMYEELANASPVGLLGAITARAEAQLLRLSVVYALLDGSSLITEEHLQAAWAMWEYAEASARYVFGDALGDPEMDKLLAAITAAGRRGLSGTDQAAVFGRHLSAGRLKELRTQLGGKQKIVTLSIPTEGRPITLSFLYAYAKEAQEAHEGAAVVPC